MDRRKFLSSLIGGVAATAAVRTFPFRVFSFPKEIQLSSDLLGRGCALTEMPIIEMPVPVDVTLSLFDVAIWISPIGGPYRLLEEISLSEAKARYGYEWKPGHPKTQRAERDHRIYCAPQGISTTGIIPPT